MNKAGIKILTRHYQAPFVKSFKYDLPLVRRYEIPEEKKEAIRLCVYGFHAWQNAYIATRHTPYQPYAKFYNVIIENIHDFDTEKFVGEAISFNLPAIPTPETWTIADKFYSAIMERPPKSIGYEEIGDAPNHNLRRIFEERKLMADAEDFAAALYGTCKGHLSVVGDMTHLSFALALALSARLRLGSNINIATDQIVSSFITGQMQLTPDRIAQITPNTSTRDLINLLTKPAHKAMSPWFSGQLATL